MEFIFTCNAKFEKLAMYEFKKYDDTFELKKWIGDGVGLATSQLKIEEISENIYKKPIIFTRHIFEVGTILDKNDYKEKIVAFCEENIIKKATFCIQTRGTMKAIDDINNLSEQIAKELVSKGYKLDVAKGSSIVSLYVSEESIYVGVGSAKINLSHWKGGMPHYSSTKEYNFVSRAEYKLLEAIECFGINLKNMKIGADLGAAPGGWTKVLVDNGLNCVSIDPSHLAKEINANKNVQYYHMLVEDYMKLDIKDHFDIVVNDMKMNIGNSIKVTNRFYEKIRNGGIVVVTFKLPKEFSYKEILEHISMFNGFEFVGARQLFHNRNEITVIMKKDTSKREKYKKRSNEPKVKKTISKKLQRKIDSKEKHKQHRNL